MPSAADRRVFEDQIPSFMSVFDLGTGAMGNQAAVAVANPQIIRLPGCAFAGKQFSHHRLTNSPQQQQQIPNVPQIPQAPQIPHPSQASQAPQVSQTAPAPQVGSPAPSQPLPCDPSHRHHDSTSTQTSESTDSSPTTTISCTDSSMSDPSPSSSPDSPVHLVPLAAYPGSSFCGANIPALPAGLTPLSVMDPSSGPRSPERPTTSPSPRRSRNMKGLSIQPPFVSPTLSSTLMSEPSSPSFIRPQIPAMRRKPSQLSLKTSTHDLVKSTTLDVPQSPSLTMIVPPPILQRRALKHSTSSPHMLSSLTSATFGPTGGMTIPTVLERNESGLSEFLRPSRLPDLAAASSRHGSVGGLDCAIPEEPSPIRTQMANRAAFEFEPYREQENNEDQKTPGYPDGPIAIYNDNVYLYLEPTAEEASRFDVVINVAREVRNPFVAKAPVASLEPHKPEQRQRKLHSPPQLQPQPQPQPQDLSSPSSSQAQPLSHLLLPERKAAPKLTTVLAPILEPISEPLCEATAEPMLAPTRETRPIRPLWPKRTIPDVTLSTAPQSLPDRSSSDPLPDPVSVPAGFVAEAPVREGQVLSPELHKELGYQSEDETKSDEPVSGLGDSHVAPTASVSRGEPVAQGENTPTTPKASVPLKKPEYIHIPWDHNTDIGQDLMMLCETIERKTKEGKKVLVHCQQGASRSASLIIAYGMFQNPDLTVNDAYYAAQAKSRWISPNMRLMYCLQDFQKEVVKRKLMAPPGSGFRPHSGRRSPSKAHRATLSADAADIFSPKEPLSAPLPPADEGSSGGGGGGGRGDAAGPSGAFRLSPGLSPLHRRGNSTPNSRECISPGPSSAPSSYSWTEKDDENNNNVKKSGSNSVADKFDRHFTFDLPPRASTSATAPSAPPPQKPQLGMKSITVPSLVLPSQLADAGGGSLSMKPPPSPGFASHRFGKLAIGSTGSSGGGGASDRPKSSDGRLSLSASLSAFNLFSPGLPPARHGFLDGFGAESMTDDRSDNGLRSNNLYKTSFLAEPQQQQKKQKLQSQQETRTTIAADDELTGKPSHVPTVIPAAVFPVDEPLMSPRAETMTSNPLHEPFTEFAGMHFVHVVPPTPGLPPSGASPGSAGERRATGDHGHDDSEDDLFSPRQTMFPRDPFLPFGRPSQVADPRSPPTKGETPIVRSIDELI